MERTPYKRPYQNRAMIKRAVRGRLQGRVVRAFLAYLIPQVLPWIMRLVPLNTGFLSVTINYGGESILTLSLPMLLLSFLATTFVMGPMMVHVAGYFLWINKNGDKPPSPFIVCDCFGPGYFRLVIAMLRRELHALAFAILPVIAAALIPGSAALSHADGQWVFHMNGLFVTALLIALCLYVYRNLVYSMVPYILYEDPTVGPLEALRQSRTLTQGRVAELFFLQLSFYGWMLLVPLTMMVAGIYVYPYIETTLAAYYLAFAHPQGTHPQGNHPQGNHPQGNHPQGTHPPSENPTGPETPPHEA